MERDSPQCHKLLDQGWLKKKRSITSGYRVVGNGAKEKYTPST